MRSPFAVLVRGRDDIGLVAQRYAREIRAIEPEGPYLIGGNCTGARLAFDVAWELMRSGGEVALLFLMEAFIDGDTRGGWRCCTEPWARDATLRLDGGPGGDLEESLRELLARHHPGAARSLLRAG